MTEEKTLINASMIIAYSPTKNQHVLLRNGEVVYQGDTIIFVGKSYPDQVDKKIDGTGKLLAPGFVNAHAELKYASLLRSYMEDLASREYFNEVLYEYWVLPTTQFQPTKSEARSIAELALFDLLSSGCTTIAEMGAAYRVGTEELVNIIKTIGARIYLGGSTGSGNWTLHPDGNRLKYEWDEEKGFNSLKRDLNLIKNYNNTVDGLIHVTFGVGALDLCVPELLTEVRNHATELGIRIQTIVGETVTEFREILRRYGKTPIEHMNDLNYLGPDLILVHGLVTSEHPWTGYPGGGNDLKLLAESGASIAETAWTYLRGGRWLHTHAKYQRAGINMAVGTAGFPQDILIETQAAILASKLIEGDTYATTAIDGYNAATLGGARALGRNDLGRISKGAKADLLIFNLQSRRMSPIRDPIKNIIYSATSEDIEKVIIAGKNVVSYGKVDSLDELRLALDIQKVSERFWETIPRADFAKRTIDEIAPLSIPRWEP